MLLALATLAVGCAAAPRPAALVLRGGLVHTVDSDRPRAEAVAVRDGRIVFVGATGDASSWTGPETRIVELDGRLVLPGFHDAHVHPVSGGIELGECDLNPASTVEDIERIIAGCVASSPEAPWLRGGGFALPLFPDGAPSRELLDRLVPDRPAFLTSADAHTAWVNTRALDAAGIRRDTPDPPPDGVIVRDATGAPQGTLREAALGLVARHLPRYTAGERSAGLRRALDMAAAYGVTTLHEANIGEPGLAAYAAAEREGTLTARVIAAIGVDADEVVQDQVARLLRLRSAYAGVLVHPAAAKIFMDGVIEGGTAALLEPYLDRPGFRGQLRWSPETLAGMVQALDAAGFKVHVHAIGDRAIRETFDAFAQQHARDGGAGPRHVMAHIQLFDPADIPRFAELGVVAAFQPLWAYADTYITELTEPRLGPERSRWLYPIRSVAETGAILAGGSDWSVTTMNPLPAIEVAITRRAPDAPPGPAWIPEEQVDLETMIRAYTIGGALAADLEHETGSITEGKAADLVVLDRNLFEIPAHEIGEAKVVMTIFGGRVVHQAR